MISIQLVDKLYRESGIVTVVKNGRFIEFADYIEIEKAPAVTEGQFENLKNNLFN